VDSQERELRDFAERRGWSIYKVYRDQGVSGTKESRPALNEVLSDCRRRRVDILAIWKFDRLARTIKQLVNIAAELHDLGVELVSLTEQVDTTSAMGKVTFHVLGAVAELERSLIAERTKAALKEARRKGKRLGRPSLNVSADLVARIKADRMNGTMSFRALAKKHGVTPWCVQRLVERDFVSA
jgi:DNA invertase Pin-like site-specific DNA recombinase